MEISQQTSHNKQYDKSFLIDIVYDRKQSFFFVYNRYYSSKSKLYVDLCRVLLQNIFLTCIIFKTFDKHHTNTNKNVQKYSIE